MSDPLQNDNPKNCDLALVMVEPVKDREKTGHG